MPWETRAAANADDDPRVTLGFMPLVDSAPLIVAQALGFAADEGLQLTLVREISWANIRDRVVVGRFDAAQMLAPMPIASSLGVGPIPTPMAAPLSLGLGGNAVTLSRDLFAAMEAEGASLDDAPRPMGEALARVVARRGAAGEAPLSFAVVHPFSGHNYDLRYWLAAVGIAPERDVRILTLPPSLMSDAIAERQIDGFCAGEPWNSLAVESGAGVIVATKSALWRQGPDKVIGMRADWAERRPKALRALIRALYRAGRWASEPQHRDELAALLAQPAHLDAPAELLRRALEGRLVRRRGEPAKPVSDFLVFNDHAANFPWRSHALWFATQMARWGQIAGSPQDFATAAGVYRPDLYRAALADLGVDLPRASAKIEGALQQPTPVASRNGAMALGPDGFFDGRLFDPDHIADYLAGFAIASRPAGRVE